MSFPSTKYVYPELVFFASEAPALLGIGGIYAFR